MYVWMTSDKETGRSPPPPRLFDRGRWN